MGYVQKERSPEDNKTLTNTQPNHYLMKLKLKHLVEKDWIIYESETQSGDHDTGTIISTGRITGHAP